MQDISGLALPFCTSIRVDGDSADCELDSGEVSPCRCPRPQAECDLRFFVRVSLDSRSWTSHEILCKTVAATNLDSSYSIHFHIQHIIQVLPNQTSHTNSHLNSTTATSNPSLQHLTRKHIPIEACCKLPSYAAEIIQYPFGIKSTIVVPERNSESLSRRTESMANGFRLYT